MKARASYVFIVSFVILFQFCNIYAEASLLEDRLGQNREINQRIALIQKDISTINLLNGLYLTKSQAEQIKQLAEEFYQAENQWLDSPEVSNELIETEKALLLLRKEVQKGVPARDEIPDAAQAQHKKNKQLKIDHYKKLHTIYKSFDTRLNELLTPEQMGVVTTFKTCLIPPKDLRDPVRAGQAHSSQGTIKRIRNLRAIPLVNWEKRKQKIVSKHVEKESQNKLTMTKAEKSERIMKIIGIIEKSRVMNDTEFELEKENLAEEMALPKTIEKLQKQITFRKPDGPKPKKSKPIRFLLTKNIISILDERLNNGIYE